MLGYSFYILQVVQLGIMNNITVVYVNYVSEFLDDGNVIVNK